MLSMLHVLMVYGWFSQARQFSRAALGALSSISEEIITSSFYGTTTRIARIVGIYFLLSLQSRNSVDCAIECQLVLRKVFSKGMLFADCSSVRYEEFAQSLSIYQLIAQYLDGETDRQALASRIVDLCILSGPKAKKRIIRKLNCIPNSLCGV